jgi:CRISPR-associated endoribonuclease Cas6
MPLSSSEIINSFAQLHLPFAVFKFHLIAKDRLYLPAYKGSALRGGFGAAFKKVCCVNSAKKYCNDCQLNANCAYAYVFETPQTSAYRADYTATNLPHPFVILPPLSRKETLEPGESLTFGLTLIGRGIDFLPYYVYAFDELGRMGLGRERGRYQLEQVTNDEDQQIYHINSGMLSSDFKTRDFGELLAATKSDNHHEIKLHFITPTRITEKNQLTKQLPFELLLRNLLRRGSLLAEVHAQPGRPWPIDFSLVLEYGRTNVELRSSNLTWYDWERFSNRQQRRINLKGFIGTVRYHGELTPFLPLIELGHFIHIGKNTSFGMGYYVVE